jgi:hypothetical protein
MFPRGWLRHELMEEMTASRHVQPLFGLHAVQNQREQPLAALATHVQEPLHGFACGAMCCRGQIRRELPTFEQKLKKSFAQFFLQKWSK